METVISFFEAIWDAFKRLFGWFGDAYDAIIEFFKGLPEWVFSELVDGFVDFFHSIPVPDFFASAASTFNNIPDSVAYFAAALQINYGVPMVLGAYLLRFAVRRLPIFG